MDNKILWEYKYTHPFGNMENKYRLVAYKSEFTYDELVYAWEKLDGYDAMQVARWITVPIEETSILFDAIGQYFLSLTNILE